MKKLWMLRYWLVTLLGAVSLICLVAYHQHEISEQYRGHRATYCAAFSKTTVEEAACIEERESAKDYQKWWFVLISWPEGISTWALFFTLAVIGWQSNETRRSASATEKAAIATENSVAVARNQIEMMRDKERARIELMAFSLELNNEHSPYWLLSGNIKSRNTGTSTAYITRSQTELFWYRSDTKEPLQELSGNGNVFSDSYIDATKDWNTEPPLKVFFFKSTESTTVDWFANGVYDGTIIVILRAVVEYTTVGTAYRRFCQFQWKGTGSYTGWALALAGDAPTTIEGKVAAGGWHTVTDEESEYDPHPQAN